MMITFAWSVLLLLRVNFVMASLSLLMILEIGPFLVIVCVAIGRSIAESVSGSMRTLKSLRSL